MITVHGVHYVCMYTHTLPVQQLPEGGKLLQKWKVQRLVLVTKGTGDPCLLYTSRCV